MGGKHDAQTDIWREATIAVLAVNLLVAAMPIQPARAENSDMREAGDVPQTALPVAAVLSTFLYDGSKGGPVLQGLSQLMDHNLRHNNGRQLVNDSRRYDMRWIVLICLCALLVLAAHGALAKIYSWTDANGIRNYSNDPPPEGVNVTNSWQEVVTVPPAVEDVSGRDTGNQRETRVTMLGNGVVVPVTIGYQGRQIAMKLKVDTGADYTAVYEPAAENYDLDEFVPLKAYVADGKVIDAKGVIVEFLRVGPKTQPNAEVVVVKQSGNPTPYHGLLGMSFMRHHKHYIDYERQVIVWLDQ